MSNFRSFIALILVFAQGFVALGLGPRALCQDADGSSRTDFGVVPCCCVVRHDAGPACCEGDGDDGDGAGALQLGITTIRAAGCGCVHTPIPFENVTAGRPGLALLLDAGSHLFDTAASYPLPAPALIDPIWRAALAAGPPGAARPRCLALAQLASVQLRL